jgi:hypothetical protein
MLGVQTSRSIVSQGLESAVSATSQDSKRFQSGTHKGKAQVTRGALGIYTITATLDEHPNPDKKDETPYQVTIRIGSDGKISGGQKNINLSGVSGAIVSYPAQKLAEDIIKCLAKT